MAEEDQAKPLAPAAYHFRSDDAEKATSIKEPKLQLHDHHKKCIKCCGCFTALLLIHSLILLVLLLTTFRVKDPVIKLNGIRLGPGSGTHNLTLVANVSVKNPNVAAFRFNSATTSITYNGTTIGQALSPAGNAKARHTLWMNVTVDITPQKIMAVPRLREDELSSQAINVSSFTRIEGRVKILKIIKRHVVLKLICIMNLNLTSREIGDQSCNRHPRM